MPEKSDTSSPTPTVPMAEENQSAPQNRLESARRRLFQDEQPSLPPNDQNSILENIENLLTISREQAKQKYNFDFATETPLEGDWEWEKVTSTRDEVPKPEQ